MQIHRLLTGLHREPPKAKGLPIPGWILMNMSKQSRHKTLLVWVVPLDEFLVMGSGDQCPHWAPPAPHAPDLKAGATPIGHYS